MTRWEVAVADTKAPTLVQAFWSEEDLTARMKDGTRATVVLAAPDYAEEMACVLAGGAEHVRWGGPQIDERALASYVPTRRRRFRCLVGKYARADRAEVGVRALVDSRRFRAWRGVMLVSVSPGVAVEVVRRASRSVVPHAPARQDPDVRLRQTLLKTYGPVDIPAFVRKSFVGESPAAHGVRDAIVRASRTRHPVLILGETGTGKDVVARLVHLLSTVDGLFVPVACGAFPADLLEVEMFGYVKGAFTGADADKVGLFEAAGKGTLFLDEVTDLPLAHQAKLVRMVKDGSFRPVGATVEKKGRARIIAATCKDILREVAAGRFRADLYERLWVSRIVTPPLRDHPEDIPAMARCFWSDTHGYSEAESLPFEALSLLRDHVWNGNARELREFLNALDAATMGLRPTVEVVRDALEAWKGRATPRDYAWAERARRGDR